MNLSLDMIWLITEDLPSMRTFYTDTLGMKVIFETDDYVEFENAGTRFALSTQDVMRKTTQHTDYEKSPTWQRYELAFKTATRDEVDTQFQSLIEKWATLIREPHDTPWWHRTAFFADPDGNIHEIFFWE